MKKNRLFALFCMVIFGMALPGTAGAQEVTVTIGEKGTQSVNVPIRFRDKNSYTQVIYPAESLAPLVGKQIRTLTFYPKGTSNGTVLVPDSVKVYIGGTDKTEFDKTTKDGYVDLESMELCYQGVPDHDWNTENDYIIELDSPFYYADGTQNLVIAVLDCGRGNYSSSINFYAYGAGSNRTLGYSNDNLSIFLMNYAISAQGTLSSNNPVVKMEGGDIPTTPLPKILTSEINFGQIRAASADTQTIRIKNIGLDGLQITGVTTDNAAFSAGEYPAATLAHGESAEIPVIFAPQDVQTYQGQVTVTTNHGEVVCSVTGEAYPANSIRIGDENSTSYTNMAPIHTGYAYSRTEIGFTAEELAAARGKRITELSFYLKPGTTGLNEPVRIYMVANDRDYVYRFCNFLSTTGLTPHYEGDMTSLPSGEVKIKLSRPFVMEEGKSMVWIVFEHDGGKAKGENFVYTPESKDCVVYATHSSQSVPVGANSSVSTYRPSTGFVYTDLPSGPEVTLENTLDFGLIRATETATRTLKIYNTGIADLQVTGFSVAAPFSFDESNLPVTIPAGESVEINVSYSSPQAGEHSETATVITDAGNAQATLSGKSYPENAYFQHFDGEKAVPKAWRTVREDESRSTSYSAKTTGGFDNSGYVEVGMNYGVNRLVSPQVVNGMIYFYAKKSSSASYNSQIEFKVYTSTDMKNWGEPLLDVGSELTSYWQRYELNVPQNVYVGFYMNYGAIDEFFAWEANIPQYDLVMDEIRSLSYTINEGAKTEIVFSCFNGGTEPVPAGAYHFELMNAADTQAPVYTIPGNMELPVADTAYVFKDSLVINLTEKVKTDMPLYIRSVYDADQDSTNNVTAQKNVTIVPYISELALSEGASADRPKDVGIFSAGTSKTAQITFTNKGIAPLEITSIEAVAPFSVDKTAMNIAGKVGGAEQKEVLTVTVNGEPGVYNGEIHLEYEGLGDRVIYLTAEIMPSGTLLESFEREEVPPVFWVRVCDTRENPSDRKGWERDAFNCYKNSTTAIAGETSCMMHTATLADTLITPRLKVKEGDSLSFYAARRYANSGTYLQVLYSADKVTWNTLLDLNSETGFTTGTYEFNPYSCPLPAGEYYIGFASVGAMLDMVRGPEVLYADHDLTVTGFSGRETGMVNYAHICKLTYRNMGKQTESTYKVVLKANDEEVASVEGEAIGSLDILTSELRWVPREAGTYDLYAELRIDGDENPGDNRTDTITVTVSGETAELIIPVGTPDAASGSNSDLVNANYRHTGIKAVYTRNELGDLSNGADITRVTIPYYLTKEYKGEFRVWLGNTEEETVSSGSFTVENMTLLYEGHPFGTQVGSKEEPEMLELVLNEPLKYTGGNLCLIMAADSTGYAMAIGLYKHATEAIQSVKYQNDSPNGTAYVTAPEVFSSITSGYTQNSFVPVVNFYTTKATPVISGRVVEDGTEGVQIPLQGAEVVLTSGDAQYTAITGPDGDFEVKIFQSGQEYQMTVTLKSYVTDTSMVEVGDTDMSVGTIVLKIDGGVGISTVTGKEIRAYVDRNGYLHATAGDDIRTIRIYTVGGRLCAWKSPMEPEAVVDMSRYESGIYVIDIVTATGNRRIKIVR